MRQANLMNNSHHEFDQVADDEDLLRILADCSDDDLDLIEQVKRVFPGAQVGIYRNET